MKKNTVHVLVFFPSQWTAENHQGRMIEILQKAWHLLITGNLNTYNALCAVLRVLGSRVNLNRSHHEK